MVSIIIPLYNGSQFIEQTLDSCVNQGYKDIEIIVINDCSTDDSEKKVYEKVKNDERIIYFKNEHNLGFCKSANKGIELSKGEYIIVLGQDDLLEKRHVQTMLNLFKEGVGCVYCNYSLIDENGIQYEQVKNASNSELTIHDFLYMNAMHSCGVMLRSSIVKQVGGYPEFEAYPQYGEWYLWIKIVEQSKIVFCKDVMPLYRRHRNNLTNTFFDRALSKGLNKYWNICRFRAMKVAGVTMLEKIHILMFILWVQIKSIVR